MRLRSLSFLGIFCFGLTSVAEGTFTYGPMSTPLTGPRLEIWAVRPPHPVNWTSPKTLLKSTLKNALEFDPAPNGHLMVHLVGNKENEYGVKEILTGMSRAHKMQTVETSIFKGLGLSAMTYDFEGQFDAALKDRKEIAKEQRKRRVAMVVLPLSSAQADRLMKIVSLWIKHGSYRHYGGSKNVSAGEGAGCADFALYLLSVALDGKIDAETWSKWSDRVYLPYALIRTNPEGKILSHKVSLHQVKKWGTEWAENENNGELFETADPEKFFNWVLSHSDGSQTLQITPSVSAEHPPLFSNPFYESTFDEALYPIEDDGTIQSVWNRINAAESPVEPAKDREGT